MFSSLTASCFPTRGRRVQVSEEDPVTIHFEEEAHFRKEAYTSRANTEFLRNLAQDDHALGKLPDIPHAKLGVIRLDYHYPAQIGDIDDPDSFEYPVVYRAVPGLTFQMCMEGKMTPEVEEDFVAAIKYLDEQGVSAITGDCGFMLWFQELASQHTHLPIAMSSLCSLPSISVSLSKHEKIAIFTANGSSLETMHDLIKEMCGIDSHQDKFVIVGCEDVEGFDPIFVGEKLDIEKATAGIVEKAKRVIREHPIRGILFECTQLPPFSDAVRAATHKPVWDAITNADFFIRAFVDNPRFGLNDWHAPWDGVNDRYVLGDCLTPASKKKLVTIQRGDTVLAPSHFGGLGGA
jgi:hypothetical protein